MSADRLISRRKAGELAGLSKSSIFRLEKAGRFPPGLKIKPNVVRYSESEVLAWVEQRKREGRKNSWAHAMAERERREAETLKLQNEAALAAAALDELAQRPRTPRRPTVCTRCGGSL
jgi:prophage regulatory protein